MELLWPFHPSYERRQPAGHCLLGGSNGVRHDFMKCGVRAPCVCDILRMYLRFQQLAVAVSVKPADQIDPLQKEIAFNTLHSSAQLHQAIFYLFYPLQVFCVVLSKLFVIDRITSFLRKASSVNQRASFSTPSILIPPCILPLSHRPTLPTPSNVQFKCLKPIFKYAHVAWTCFKT